MRKLWPRLDRSHANGLFLALPRTRVAVAPAHLLDEDATYAQVGVRATGADLSRLRQRIIETATSFGFPADLHSDQRIAFDRACAPVLHDAMPMTWAEAASMQVWDHLALVVLPDVTDWRWYRPGSPRNRERWLAVDMTRHAWSRLWWQHVVFADDPGLLTQLTESDLNQLLERRAIGGSPALVCALGRAIVANAVAGVPRRALIRDSARRLRRRLAFTEDLALDAAGLQAFADQLVTQSREALLATDPLAKEAVDSIDE